MKYIFPFIFILLEQEISYLIQAEENDLPKNITRKDIKEKVFKRNAHVRSVEETAKTFNYDVVYGVSEAPIKMKSRNKNQPLYQNVVCTRAPGKIVCELGRFKFVVNNEDHEMDDETIEKFVTMAYNRYAEGDNCFDVAVDERETTQCACTAVESTVTTEGVPLWKLPPVSVECNLISNEKLKMCNPHYEPTEKIYSCKAKILGMKKRNVLNLSVSENGMVSYKVDPLAEPLKVRHKRECESNQSIPFQRVNVEHETSEFNKYIDDEMITEESDISNLRYHTWIPFVRNYTDFCPHRKKCWTWCPEYSVTYPCQTEKPPKCLCPTSRDKTTFRYRRQAQTISGPTTITPALASTTILTQANPAVAEGSVGTGPSHCISLAITTRQCGSSTTLVTGATACAKSHTAGSRSTENITTINNQNTICTVEVTTEEVLLKASKRSVDTRKRRRLNWYKTHRLMEPLKFNSANINKNENSDWTLQVNSRFDGGDSHGDFNKDANFLNLPNHAPVSISPVDQLQEMDLLSSTYHSPGVFEAFSREQNQNIKENINKPISEKSDVLFHHQIIEDKQLQLKESPAEPDLKNWLGYKKNFMPHPLMSQNPISSSVFRNKKNNLMYRFRDLKLHPNIDSYSEDRPRLSKTLYRPVGRRHSRKIPKFKGRQVNRRIYKQIRESDMYRD